MPIWQQIDAPKIQRTAGVPTGIMTDPQTGAVVPLTARTATPDSITGLQLWLDASQPCYTASYAAVCTNLGDQVGIWPDQSGNGRFGTGSTTKPTYNPTGLNGKPCIAFNGNSTFSTASFLDATYNTACTVFAVSDGTGSAANKIIFGTAANSLYLQRNGATKASSIAAPGLTPAPAVLTYDTDIGIDVFSYGGATYQYEYNRLFKPDGLGGSASVSTVASTGNLGLTGAVTIGDAASGSFTWPGTISELLIYNVALTQEQIRQIYDYLAAKWGLASKPFVLCAGNSVTSGTNSTGGPTQNISLTGTNYPGQLWALLTSAYDVRTDAYPGRTLAQMIAETPKFGDLMFLPAASSKNICVVWEISNSLVGSQSRGFAYRQLVTYCKARRNQGFKVIVVTCMPRQDASPPYAGFETDRLAVNILIRANWATFADGIADVAADARLQNPLNTTYFGADKIHLTDVGYGVVAGIVSPVVLSM